MPPSKLTKSSTIASFVLISLFVGANLVVSSLYAGRAWPRAIMGGQNVGGYSVSQLKSTAERLQTTDSSLDLKIDNKTFHLAAADIGAKPDTAEMITDALKPPSSWLPVLGLIHPSPPVRLSWLVDSEKLTDELKGVLDQINAPPLDATVVVIGDKPVVLPGKPGTGVELDQAKTDITQALAAGANSVEISPGKVDPTITPETLQPIIERMKQLIDTPFKLTYQGRTFSPDKTTVGSWLAVNPGGAGPQIVTKADQIYVYLAKVAKSVDVKPKDTVIDTVNGAVQSTTPGSNGLAVDQNALAASITQSLLAGQALTTEISTQVVAFKTVYNKTYNLDFGKYIEVNLSTQHMWVYQDHQVVMDTPITSGSTGTGHPTVQGLFNVYTKERDRWLDGRPLGYNYNVWVQYWMPFYKDYGLHDASWRHSFGGSDYYYGGSHGCVNMPIPAAAWLYSWVDVGTPVWVHS